MLVKILGVIDVLAGIAIAISFLTEISNYFFILLGVILLIKAFLGFPKDIGGWIDLLTAVVLLLSVIVAVPLFIKIIFMILILQKGISSFL